jgi:hypothetical protein
MKKLIIALLIAGLMVGSAMAHTGQAGSLKGFYMDWKHAGSFFSPVDALSVCAKADADANSWNNKNEAFTFTNNVATFSVNSKDDPVIGTLVAGSQSVVADKIKFDPASETAPVTFEGIEGMAQAGNSADMNVVGAKLAVLDIKSDVDTEVNSGCYGNFAESSSDLNIKALAMGCMNICMDGDCNCDEEA